MRAHRKIAATALAGTLLATVLGAAGATAAETTATFTVAAGTLNLTTDAASAALTVADDLIGGATATGALGQTTVSDGRATSTGWTVNVSSSDFSNGTDTILATAAKMYVLVADGPTPVSGIVVPSTTHILPTSALGLSTTPSPFMTATATGANEVTYTPTVDVTLAATTKAGTYSGTITQTAV